MNYEEKYKKALERARKDFNDENTSNYERRKLEVIFPELRESEDERIRKDLKFYLEVRRCQTNDDEEYISCNKFLSWLEKQGEQKPTPKFKIGDTIHKIGENTVFPRTIEKIEDGDYVCNNSHSFVNIKFQDDYELVEQKTDWSEEDEEMIDFMIEFIESLCWRKDLTQRKDNVLSWLKSLKSKKHWKPSEEQMQALFEAKLASTKNREYFLGLLYEDLKKL